MSTPLIETSTEPRDLRNRTCTCCDSPAAALVRIGIRADDRLSTATAFGLCVSHLVNVRDALGFALDDCS